MQENLVFDGDLDTVYNPKVISCYVMHEIRFRIEEVKKKTLNLVIWCGWSLMRKRTFFSLGCLEGQIQGFVNKQVIDKERNVNYLTKVLNGWTEFFTHAYILGYEAITFSWLCAWALFHGPKKSCSSNLRIWSSLLDLSNLWQMNNQKTTSKIRPKLQIYFNPFRFLSM